MGGSGPEEDYQKHRKRKTKKTEGSMRESEPRGTKCKICEDRHRRAEIAKERLTSGRSFKDKLPTAAPVNFQDPEVDIEGQIGNSPQQLQTHAQTTAKNLSDVATILQSLQSSSSSISSLPSTAPKLLGQVDDCCALLRVWNSEMEFDHFHDLRDQKLEFFPLVEETLMRLQNSVGKLNELSRTANLKLSDLEDVEQQRNAQPESAGNDWDSIKISKGVISQETLNEPIGEHIRDTVAVIESDIHELTLLAELFYEDTSPNNGLKAFVDEAKEYLGSESALEHYGINPSQSPKEAFRAAKEAAQGDQGETREIPIVHPVSVGSDQGDARKKKH